jgi:hypothetical protein
MRYTLLALFCHKRKKERKKAKRFSCLVPLRFAGARTYIWLSIDLPELPHAWGHLLKKFTLFLLCVKKSNFPYI